MNKSAEIGQIAAALAKAQSQMGVAKKDSSNPFFKSKYSDLASVVDAIKKPLSDNCISYTQLTDMDNAGGVIIETTLMHESGEWISGRLRMLPVKNDPQGIGSCITYARRYGLQAAVGIPSDDDDGNAASGNGANKPFERAHKPSDGAIESLTDRRQEEIRRMAINVTALVKENTPNCALALSEMNNLDADEKVALWSLLDSKVRSSLKKAKEETSKEIENV